MTATAKARNYEFVRARPTPVIANGHAAYDDTDILTPSVSLDAANARWVCCYGAYSTANAKWTLAAATCPYRPGTQFDGLDGPWTVYASNPVMSPAAPPEGYISTDGSILKKGSTWYHIYNGATSTPNTSASTDSFQIFAATASDPLGTWTRLNSGNPVIGAINSGTQWADPKTILSPDGNGFELYCFKDAGAGMAARECWRYKSTDAVTWVGARLFYPPPFCNLNIGAPCPTRVGNELRVCFDMQDTALNNASLGRCMADAVSTDDGRTWTFRGRRFTTAGGNSWETGSESDSRYFYINPPGGPKFCLIHGGSTGTGAVQGINAQLGLATADYLAGVI